MIDIVLSSDTLSIDQCTKLVSDEACGGNVIFSGTVRNITNDKKVIKLNFEAYDPMAKSEMRKIAETIIEKWPVKHVVIHHRIGELYPEDIAVIIVIASAHRNAAFDACQYAIDTLKETVPIWKKEFFEDGEVWVAAHP